MQVSRAHGTERIIFSNPSTMETGSKAQRTITRQQGLIKAFRTTPLSEFCGVTLMGALPKKHSMGKYSVIHDLSWPSGHSHNN